MANPDPYELGIVGGGPAGFSTAVFAESERVNVVLIERKQKLGGQARESSLIENYLGFPEGVTGPDLSSRMVDQATRFTADIVAPVSVEAIERTDDGYLAMHTDATEPFLGRAVLISCGVEYRILQARGLAAWLGRGVDYGSPNLSSRYENQELIVIGGANSAGQAAVNLSENPGTTVHMLIRGPSIEEKMSGYLVDKIEEINRERDNIHVHTNTTLVAVEGKEGRLTTAKIMQGDTESDMPVDHLFVMIGAVPKTQWLPDEVVRDEKGFIVTGTDLGEEARRAFMEKTRGRVPYSNETSMPGVFAGGDARCGTIKRVMAAAGEGPAVVANLHRYYQSLRNDGQ